MAAFGKTIARSADAVNDRVRSSGQDLDGQPLSPEQATSAAAPVVPAPTPAPAAASLPISPAAAPGRPTPFARPQPSAQPAGPMGNRPRPATPPPAAPAAAAPAAPAPAPAPAPAEPPAAPRPAPPASAPLAVASEVSELFTGYTRQVVEQSRRQDGLSLRLERLVDEVSDHLGYSAEQREGAKVKALGNPSEWEKRLTEYYRENVVPVRKNTARTLAEARQKNPGKLVYVQVQQGTPTLKVLDRSSVEGKAQSILDGAVVETVAASRTPFRSPAEVFGRRETVQVIDAASTDEAFGASSPRSPRP